MGDMFAVGGCDCSCNTSGCLTSINGHVTGCHNANVPSVTVTLHDSTAGGTVLASTTTNSGGLYTFTNISATSGNNIVVVISLSGGRFLSVNVTLTWTSGSPGSSQWGCGKTTAVNAFSPQTLSPASGYVCDNGGCANPISKTLHLTDSVYGACVLSWTAATTWIGTATVSFSGSGPPCHTCAGGSVDVSYEWDGAATISAFTVSCMATGVCPSNLGNFTGGNANFYTTPVYVCPPSLSFSFSNSGGNGAWSVAALDNLYNCAATSFTITE